MGSISHFVNNVYQYACSDMKRPTNEQSTFLYLAQVKKEYRVADITQKDLIQKLCSLGMCIGDVISVERSGPLRKMYYVGILSSSCRTRIAVTHNVASKILIQPA